MQPKYSLLEVERRWLVDLDRVDFRTARSSRRIDDLFLDGGRLRLRRIVADDGSVVFKLGKKYGRQASLSEPVTNLYLTGEEYTALCALPGLHVSKTRYSIAGGALDLYTVPASAPAIFEADFESEADALRYQPPSFVTREVTGEPDYSGAALANPFPPACREP